MAISAAAISMLQLAIQRVKNSSTRMNSLAAEGNIWCGGMQIRFTEFKHIRTAAAGDGSLNKSDCGWRSHAAISLAIWRLLPLWSDSDRAFVRKQNETAVTGEERPLPVSITSKSPAPNLPRGSNVIFFVEGARKHQSRGSCELWSDGSEFETQLALKRLKRLERLEQTSIPAFIYLLFYHHNVQNTQFNSKWPR